MPSEPITAPVACELLGISRQRLNQLTSAGWITREARGQYDMSAVLQGYFRFLKSHRAQKSKLATRLDEIKIRKLELEIERHEAALIPRDDVLWFIDRTVAEVESAAPGLSRRLARHLDDKQRAQLPLEISNIISDVRALVDRIRGEFGVTAKAT